MSAGNGREFIDHLQKKEGKEQAMKCPLPTMIMTVDSFPPELWRNDCLKEECAWWDKPLQTCAISRIANRLDQITFFMAKREEREGG